MRITLIRSGIVENIVEADMEFAQQLGYDLAVESDIAGIGWQWRRWALPLFTTFEYNLTGDM